MIVEYIRYKSPVDRGEAFQKAYESAGESLRASSHCLGFELSRCSDAPDHYILRIQWESAEGHLRGFRQSPEFGPFLTAVKPFITDIEEMRHYDLTPVRWAR